MEGMGRCSLLLPTPQMMADVHTFYRGRGVSGERRKERGGGGGGGGGGVSK